MKKAPNKIYVVDNGFVQSTAFSLSENLGRLLENQVFVELLRRGYEPGNTLFYYRTRNDREKTRKRELDALVESAKELHCNNLIVITNSNVKKEKYCGLDIEITTMGRF